MEYNSSNTNAGFVLWNIRHNECPAGTIEIYTLDETASDSDAVSFSVYVP